MPPEEGEVGYGRRGDAGELADDAPDTHEAPGAPMETKHGNSQGGAQIYYNKVPTLYV